MKTFLVASLVCGLLLSSVAAFGQPAPASAAVEAPAWTPSDPPNTPTGEAKGIFPGRVTWIRDVKATPWDGKTGKWWEPGNIDEKILADMFSKSLRGLTGAATDQEAWDKLFRYFNKTHGRGDRAWRPGESIAVKINCNNTFSHADADNNIDQSPQATRALLRQLTGPAGVAQKDIVIYDATIKWKLRAVPDRIYTPLHAEFPEVRWMDGTGADGREAAEFVDGAITYSTPEPELGTALPRAVVDAAYLINAALLKGHEMAGVTLCGKNHFGSIMYPNKEHDKYVTPMNRDIADYSAFVDLMGSPKLGGKTLLYIIDGLYGMQTNVGDPKNPRDRWKRLFDGEWSASYFMSQDPVAIDSVGLDFLTSEFQGNLGFSGAKQFAKGAIKNCDNYLLEAARGTNAKFGPYKPNGVIIGSLGTHEHWNNPVDKQYSRNLKRDGLGIELLTLHCYQSKRLEKIWETPAELKIPESAFYDRARKVIYVSNMAVAPSAKDGQGYIAKLSLDGKILANPWVRGLHSPKGMALAGNKLYVSSFDEIAEIDIEKGVIAHRYPVEGAKELNDVAVDADGAVYATDTGKGQHFIYLLKDGKTGIFLDSPELAGPNGIFSDGARLLVGGKGGRVLAVDRATKAITVLFDKSGYVDGLLKISESQYLVSDWAGTVHLLETGKPAIELLDTKPGKINAADLEWIVEEKIMLVPTFFDNRVVAYRLRDP
jgi:hypothetical protein